MKRVLFISAVNPFIEIENRHKPLWPAYLAAYTQRHYGPKKIEFRYAAGNIERAIEEYKPHCIGISSVTQNYNFAILYAQMAKRYTIPVIVGGMHISSLPSSLSPCMDVGCIGEGEQTFFDLMTLLSETGKFTVSELARINGIVFRDGQTLVQTPVRQVLSSFDQIPHPQRSLVGYKSRGYVYTARGCAYKCVFCSCHRYWGTVRYAPAEYVVEEVQELVENGATRIRFSDENFILNRERLEHIADLIRKTGLHKKVKFSCWCRANNVDSHIVNTLKSINIVSVKFGFESGNNRILNYLKGQVTVENNRNAIRLFTKAGIQVNGDFIFGTPDETEKEVMDTYNFIKKNPLSFVDINIFSALPGTPVWEYAKKRGLVSDTSMDWSRLNFKFITSKDKAIILSERLSYEQLYRLYRKFQIVRFFKAFLALFTCPWLDEIVPTVLRKLWGRMIKTKIVLNRRFS